MSVEEQAMGPDQEATESDVVSDVTDSTDVINANDVADAADVLILRVPKVSMLRAPRVRKTPRRKSPSARLVMP